MIGEFDASPQNCEAAARWKWTDHFVRQAAALNTAVMIWDNGLDHLDRSSHVWRDPTSINITINAVKGIPNSLADSTTDTGATTQNTSAYIFHKVGDAVGDQALPYLLNGNTLSSITTNSGSRLVDGTDYSVSGSVITFNASFLSKYLSTNGVPGSKGNLTVSFSKGASLNVEIVEWDIPTLSSTTAKASGGQDLAIPITWKGLNKVAAVKMVENNGTYLFDSWTQYLGPLQQARAVSCCISYGLSTY